MIQPFNQQIHVLIVLQQQHESMVPPMLHINLDNALTPHFIFLQSSKRSQQFYFCKQHPYENCDVLSQSLKNIALIIHLCHVLQISPMISVTYFNIIIRGIIIWQQFCVGSYIHSLPDVGGNATFPETFI